MGQKLVNGSFEDPLGAEWYPVGAGFTRDASVTYTGSGYSLKYVGPGEFGQAFQIVTGLTTGKRYKIYARVKANSVYTSPAGDNTGWNNSTSRIDFISYAYYDINKPYRTGIISSIYPIRTNDWSLWYIGDMVLTGNETIIQVAFTFTFADGSTAWLDEVVMDEVDFVDAISTPAVRTQYPYHKDTDYNLWREHAQADVYQTEAIPSESTGSAVIPIKMAAGERQAFQMVVQPAAEWTNVTWAWDAFTGPQALDATHLEMLRVLYVPILGYNSELSSPLIVLCTELRADMIAHFADTNAARHTVGHQSSASFGAVPTTVATLLSTTGTLLTAYAAHNADVIKSSGRAYHNAQDTTHALVDATTPTTLDDCITKLNDLKAKYNAHEIETTGHNGVGTTDPTIAWIPVVPNIRLGNVPDPLPPEASSTLAAGLNSPYYFTVDIPMGTKAGVYTTSLRLVKNGALQFTNTIQVTVKSSLPSTWNFYHITGHDWSFIDDYETVDSDTRDRWMKNFFQHRAQGWNTYFTYSYSGGNITVNSDAAYPNNGDHVFGYLHSLGMDNWPIFLHPGIFNLSDGDHPVNVTPWETLTISGTVFQIFTDETKTTFTPEYLAVMKKVFDGVKAKMVAQGLTGNILWQLREELVPDTAYKTWRPQTIGRLMKSIAPYISLYDNGSPYTFYPHADIVNIEALDIPRYPAEVDQQKLHTQLGCYNNGALNQITTPPLVYRLFQWALYASGYRGNIWWTCNTWQTAFNPWSGDEQAGAVYAWSYNILYPPRGGGYETTGPVNSLRWEATAQGVMDVELFIKLQGLIDSKQHLASGGDLSTAQTALAAVATLVTHVTSEYGSNADIFCDYDPVTLDSIRSDVIDAIVLLEGYTTVHTQVGGVGHVGAVSGAIPGAVDGISH